MEISKEELVELMGKLSEVLESADAYLKAGEKVVESLRPMASRALIILLKTLNEVRKNLESQLEVSSFLSAKAQRRDFTNYMKVGFTKDQAFKLVLASIKPFDFAEVLKGVKLPESKGD